MSTSRELAIDCRHLTHRYGDFTAVDDVTLQVLSGETVGLLGPNGAGKTTVVRVLTTLSPVQEGEVAIFGFDARRNTMDIRYNLGYVPQQLSIEPALSGRQNVQWFARLYDVPRVERAQRVDGALDAMQFSDVADALASTYSGGMVRRLELAQALVTRPSLLILDEPTVGLDPIARDSVWSQVQRMQTEFGMTVLLTTHYMEEADLLCDRVALMHHGRLQAVGTPAELKASVSPDATLEDVFRHYAGADMAEDTPRLRMPEIRSTRKAAGLAIEAPAETQPVRAPRGWRRLRGMLLRIGTYSLVELQKLQHDPTELFTRMVQPALWLLIFGQTFSRLHVMDTGGVPYLAFLAPGILAQSALFVSIFYGIQIIWDRDAGILAKLMVTPAPASALTIGKSFAAGVRSVAQVICVLALAYLMGVHMTTDPLRVLAAMGVVMLGSAFFTCLSITLAGLVRNRDRLMGIGQAITMPLFFASNALYPVALMPSWLRWLSRINPLSYGVSALRTLLVGIPTNMFLNLSVLMVAAMVGIATASAMLGRLVR